MGFLLAFCHNRDCNWRLRVMFMLLQLQFEEEENLAKQQEDTLRTNFKKYELMENVNIDRSLHKLTNHYGIKYRDD